MALSGRVTKWLALTALLAVGGCSTDLSSESIVDARVESAAPSTEAPTPAPTTPATPPQPTQSAHSSARPSPHPVAGDAAITLTIPDAGIDDLRVVRYMGTPDDAEGTELNERGISGAPYGRWGGVAPGETGNFFVTGHRTSAGAPMLRVPDLRRGARILVHLSGKTITYRVAERLWIDFRSDTERDRQAAPVPGKPGKRATHPAIVLSTCATPEDNAAGLSWRDQFGNPAHRIAIVGYAA